LDEHLRGGSFASRRAGGAARVQMAHLARAEGRRGSLPLAGARGRGPPSPPARSEQGARRCFEPNSGSPRAWASAPFSGGGTRSQPTLPASIGSTEQSSFFFFCALSRTEHNHGQPLPSARALVLCTSWHSRGFAKPIAGVPVAGRLPSPSAFHSAGGAGLIYCSCPAPS